MAEQVLNRRSSLLYDRPFPDRLGVAEITVNNNSNDPGLYFADNTASSSTGLIKAGPISVGSTAPNLLPTGYTFLCKGESWLDSSSTQIFKVYDGTTWQTPKAVVSNSFGKPGSPSDGQLHYDKSLSKLYMYDAGSSSWLPT
jgi:hypothetical protein